VGWPGAELAEREIFDLFGIRFWAMPDAGIFFQMTGKTILTQRICS